MNPHSIAVMYQYIKNDKLLIKNFPNSLTSTVATWIVHLDRTRISLWRDLADAFVAHYNFNLEILPDQFDLQKESTKL